MSVEGRRRKLARVPNWRCVCRSPIFAALTQVAQRQPERVAARPVAEPAGRAMIDCLRGRKLVEVGRSRPSRPRVSPQGPLQA